MKSHYTQLGTLKWYTLDSIDLVGDIYCNVQFKISLHSTIVLGTVYLGG